MGRLSFPKRSSVEAGPPPPRLSVVIPAYNEADRIERTLRSVLSYLRRQSFVSEVLVVDDGSDDGTVDAVARCICRTTAVKVIRSPENRGKGWAIKEGMLAASGEFRLFMDADNSAAVEHWDAVAPLLEAGIDVVVGSRFAYSSRIHVAQPWARRLLGQVYRGVVRLGFSLPLTDTQAGFKVFSCRAAEHVFARAKIERWAFDVEILLIAQCVGFRTAEVALDWHDDGRSRMSILRACQMGWDLLKLRMMLRSYMARGACAPGMRAPPGSG
ncbi:MAG: glycosyltransferase family 2 protein [Xanthobacteraceae bacterium]|nr:glycosyltransferase family 2 protein [Xanthobacteraceae bacterium]